MAIRRYKHGVVLAATAALCATSANAAPPVWTNPALSPEKRAELLVAVMTPAEKYEQMVGEPGIVAEVPQCYGGRHVPGLPRLKIPTLRITNGPVGVGQNDCVPPDKVNSNPGSSMMSPFSAKATALPSAMAVAASFDRKVATRFGDLLAREASDLGLQVLEAPGINLAREPEGGRNFEYFGEDPFLSGSMAVAEIRAIQAHGLIAMPKHFVANDQETDRKRVNAIIDDRVLHELYLLPFEMAVKDGRAAAVLCSYNSVNGVQMCENRHLLTDVLRGQWGFTGYVQSDFFAVQSLAALRAGMDLEMPGLRLNFAGVRTWFTPENFTAALARGEISPADINTALRRRYTQMFRLGIFDRPITLTPIDTRRDGAIAAQLGEQGAVLLKNAGHFLPLAAKSPLRIALIGKRAFAAKAEIGEGGSAEVIPFYTVPPLEGMQKTLHQLSSPASANLTIVADDNSNLAQAIAAAKTADVVVLLAGANSAEGHDQPSLHLPLGQEAMITAIAAANPHTVVVLKDNSAILMPWIDTVPAVLESWYPGQEDGNIIAHLLLGLADPSGKTPVTYPHMAGDGHIRSPRQFPGVMDGNQRRVEYSEGLDMGYRWFDSQAVKPLFPFGYGLSYTSFALSGFSVTPLTSNGHVPIHVRFTLRNTGKVAGAEVPQVYLGFPPSAGEPPKRLIGFEKIWLKPGETKRVAIIIDPASSSHPLETFNSANQSWKTPYGKFKLMVGTSSRDIRFATQLVIHGAKRGQYTSWHRR